MADEPRKLFKTISLEERLAASEYNKLPSPTPASNDTQGSPTINTPKQTADKSGESPEIGEMSETQDKANQSPQTAEIQPTEDKNSDQIQIPKSQLTQAKEGIVTSNLVSIGTKEPIILKTLLKSPQSELPQPLPFQTPTLITSPTPGGTATAFASSISLEDRLNQSSVTSTQHLPQYFLSDLYTGFLTINTAWTTPKIEDVVEEALPPNTIPPSANQIQEAAVAFLDTQYPPQGVGQETPLSELSILQLQGAFILNNIIQSFVSTDSPSNESAVLLSQGTFTSNNVTNSFVEVVDATPIAQINQGGIDLPIYEVAVDQGVTTDIPSPLNEITIAARQGLVIENSQITESAITLDLLRYETDRALAFASPRIKHGTTVLTLQQHTASKQNAVDFPISFHGEGNPNTEFTTIELTNSIIPVLGIEAYLQQRTQAVNAPESLHGSTVADPFVTNENDKLAQAPAISTDFPQPTNAGLIPDGYSAAGTTPNLDVGDTPAPRYSSSTPAPPSSGASPIVRAVPKGQAGLTEDAQKAESNDDFIKLKVTSVRTGTTIQLKAYLTAWSDGMSATWADVQYVGRQDTLKQFTGVTRAISIAFMLPSFKEGDLELNMKKLQDLIGMTTVGQFGGNYLKGPLCKLELGGLINSYVAFSSIKWDFDPAEATMDLKAGLPHLFKVSLDGAVLGTNDDKLLEAGNAGYFAKTY